MLQPGVSSQHSQLETGSRGTSQLSRVSSKTWSHFTQCTKNASTISSPIPSLLPAPLSAVSLKPRSPLRLPLSASPFPLLSFLCLPWTRPHATPSQFLLTFRTPDTSCPGSGGCFSAQLISLFFFFYFIFLCTDWKQKIGLFEEATTTLILMLVK